MTKEFNSLDEIQKYYDEETNTYFFKEDGDYINNVVFNFDLKVRANISAEDINAHNINAYDINAGDIIAGDIDVFNINSGDINAGNINAKNIDAYNIDALNIKANGDIDAVNIKVNNIDSGNIEAINIEALDINYFAVCFAYDNIKCKSIKGRRDNAKHFVLEGKLEIEDEHIKEKKDLIKDKLNEILELCELTEEKYQIKPKGFLVDNYLHIQDDIDQLTEEWLENDQSIQ